MGVLTCTMYVCRVGVLLSEISKHSKISPLPSLRSHLTSSLPMGVLSGDYLGLGSIGLHPAHHPLAMAVYTVPYSGKIWRALNSGKWRKTAIN